MKTLFLNLLKLSAIVAFVNGQQPNNVESHTEHIHQIFAADFNLNQCENLPATQMPDGTGVKLTSDGTWLCQKFSIDKGSGKILRLNVPKELQGKELQVIVYNNQQTPSDSSNIWREASTNFLKLYAPLGMQNDVNQLPYQWDKDDSARAQPFDLSTNMGLTGNTSVVYAYRAGLPVHTGPNTIFIDNPDTDANATGAKTFVGSLLYRIVDPSSDKPSTTFNGGLPIKYESGSVAEGASITVSDVLLPGDSISIPLEADFAKAGYAIRGMKYTISTTPSTFMSDDFPIWELSPLPDGFSTTSGMDISYDANGIPKPRLSTSDGQGLFYNYTTSSTWTKFDGDITYTSSSISREWKYPIDYTLNSDVPGTLTVSIPSYTNSIAGAKDWSKEQTPFVSVTLTLDSVTEYPTLESLADVTLKNYDTSSAEHSASDPLSQNPFGIYLAKYTTIRQFAYTLYMGPVTNMNKPAGASTQTDVPLACQPRWEFQLVTGSDPNGWSYDNIQGGGWRSVADESANTVVALFPGDDEASLVDPQSLPLATFETQVPYLEKTGWRDMTTNDVLKAGSVLAPPESKTVYMLVRISAAKRALVGFGTDTSRKTASCGSNHVKIASAFIDNAQLSGQCSSFKDCVTEADKNPNKKQQDDSANKDASRFSTCMLTKVVSGNYRVVPSSKCVECTSDNHCQGGQYCHLDYGICNSEEGANNAKYYCDPESAKLVGLCREKSKDVLGKQCRNSFSPSGSSFAQLVALDTDGDASDSVSLPNAASAPGQSGTTVSSAIAMKGDASGEKFAKGSFGICGEYRFGTGSDPAKAASSTNKGYIRAALWNGYCNQDHVCMECVPGSYSQSGKVCLNGKAYSAMDVDGTVRTFAENTTAGSTLGTTMMVVLLIFMWASYMFTEARRARHQLGLPPMTWVECLFCCCGTWTESYTQAKDIKNPIA